MPSGNFGHKLINGDQWAVIYHSSVKSDCDRMAKIKIKERNEAMVIKYPIKLVGGVRALEHWAVAARWG